MRLSKSHLLFLACTLLGACTTLPSPGQGYRDEMKLIRPKPGHTLLFGQVTTSSGKPVRNAKIELFNPSNLKIEDQIPLDNYGYYLFSVKKGQPYGLIIEKEGFFPYYHKIEIPNTEQKDQYQENLTLGDHLKNHYTLYYHPGDTLLGNNSQNLLNQLINLLSAQNDLIIWIDPHGDSLDPVRINQLTGTLINAGINGNRITTGPRPVNDTHTIELTFKTGEDLAVIPHFHVSGQPPDNHWTIQFMASKKQVGKASLKGLDPVYTFQGHDGYYRYTFGNFISRTKAVQALSKVRRKGFRRPFVKSFSEIRKL